MTTLSFILFAYATGSEAWKEDIDYYKDHRTWMGLWRMCFWSGGTSQAKYPAYYECDKDFLRPYLNEPPSWFNAVRSLMLLSVFAAGFGMIFFFIAMVTDNSKESGSRYWPAGLLSLSSGICAIIALAIFTNNREQGVAFVYGGGKFFAQYWTKVASLSTVEGIKYEIETWLRWSYGAAWAGVLLSLIQFLLALASDATNKPNPFKQIPSGLAEAIAAATQS